MSLNIQYSSSYRTYNNKVPEFLQNKPRFVVAHVMKRWEDCWETSKNARILEDGKFEVQSTTSQGQWYSVNFGNDSNHPSCQCADWNKTKLPCKHFCAVFRNTESKWNDLSPLYRHLPILNLDENCLGHSLTDTGNNRQCQQQVSFLHVMSVTIAINLQPHKPTVDQSGIIFENILKFILYY